MRISVTVAGALLTVLQRVTSTPLQTRQSETECHGAPDISASAAELAAYSGAVAITDAGCIFNETLHQSLLANWPVADNAVNKDGSLPLGKRLDVRQKFGDGRTNYLGWVISIGESYLYLYRSRWRFPFVSNFAALFQLQKFVHDQTAKWKTDGYHTADLPGGWSLSIQSAPQWFPSMIPESLMDDMIRSVCEDAYSWLDTNNGAAWDILGSTGVKLYHILIWPTDARGTNPLKAHEEL